MFLLCFLAFSPLFRPVFMHLQLLFVVFLERFLKGIGEFRPVLGLFLLRGEDENFSLCYDRLSKIWLFNECCIQNNVPGRSAMSGRQHGKITKSHLNGLI